MTLPTMFVVVPGLRQSEVGRMLQSQASARLLTLAWETVIPGRGRGVLFGGIS